MSLDITQFRRMLPKAELVVDERWPSELPDHLSPSQIAMFRRCPRQYQERYIHGRKERPAEAPVIGTAVHAGLERNFEQKISSHEDLPAAELLAWFADVGWETTLEVEQAKGGEEIFWDSDPEKAMRRARAMLGEYHTAVAPRIQPTGIEGMIEVDFGVQVPVIGRFDIELDSGVVDIKTGKRKQSKPKEGWRIQAAVYGEATGKPVEFHSLTATEGRREVSIVTPLESEALLVNPSPVERAVIRSNIRMVAAEIAMCMRLLGPDEPWPTYGKFHDWACDYCGFRGDCPAWRES
jgi:hypothetical protein